MSVYPVAPLAKLNYLWIPICYFFALLLVVTSSAQENSGSVDQGKIDESNIYRNLSLGMTVVLPGPGQVIGKATDLASIAPGNNLKGSRCQGPLCDRPSINIAIESTLGKKPAYAVFLGAWKLPREYQDLGKHPLKNFANVMIVHSLGKLWIPETGLTAIRLAGRPAYRLIAHDRKMLSAKGFMYVSESNGYVFMLVATTVSAPKELRSAVENMRLSG